MKPRSLPRPLFLPSLLAVCLLAVGLMVSCHSESNRRGSSGEAGDLSSWVEETESSADPAAAGSQYRESTGDRDYGFFKSPAKSEAAPAEAPRGAESKSVRPVAARPGERMRSTSNKSTREGAGAGDDLLARLGPGEELWVIEKSRSEDLVTPDRSSEIPGSGCLMTRIDRVNVPVPLEHTEVKGKVSGYLAGVEVIQKFQNPYDSKIEAVYVFPLPQNAAVNEFIMTVGERKIRGIIRERQEAERIYQIARSQGHVASLLTQERPNIFTQKVANIEPGKAITISIHYFNSLAYDEGWYEFVFPMVVSPRFNPPCTTDGVGAVARKQNGISGQSTEVPYLAPNERSGHDISLELDLEAGVKLEQIVSASHAIEVKPSGDSRAHVSLAANDRIPNRDFVLRYRVAGDRIKSDLITHRDERGTFFSLMVYPPADLRKIERQPVEMIFVLDCSGSMKGKPLAKARQAMERALRKLRPSDSFQIIRFSTTASQLGSRPLPATPANVERGLRYVASLNSTGGTMMVEGIKAALDFPADEERLRLVSFMTDGHIGNENQIFHEIHRRLGSARIFSFGIGSSVNRHLLEGMARLGRGAVAYVGLDEGSGRAVDLFYDRIRHPALTDLEIDWGGATVKDVYPGTLPDLFVGRPVLLTGRIEGELPATIRIRGKAGGASHEVVVNVDGDDPGASHPALASVWARTRIRDLSDRARRAGGDPEIASRIRQTALEFGLMSSFTAFVAVDSSRRTEGSYGTTVKVPVPVPDGMRYDTTVQGK